MSISLATGFIDGLQQLKLIVNSLYTFANQILSSNHLQIHPYKLMQSHDEFKRNSSISIKISPRQRSSLNSISGCFDNESDPVLEQQPQTKRKPIKKNTLSTHRSFKKQRIEDIFKSIIKTITFNSQKQTIENQKSKKLRIPHSLVNTLYRQNIRNYNPYIATLEQLEQEKSLSLFEKERISNICHIGIAKTFIKAKKYSLEPKYVTVNVLIRTYMRDKMWEEVKYKEQTYDSVFFIPTNELALSFNPKKVPKGLDQFMSTQFFTSIINQVNAIITNEYLRYKSSNMMNVSESLSGKLILGGLLLLSLIFCLNKNVFLLPVIFAFGVFYIAYLVFACKEKLERLVESKSVISTIIQRINALFQSIRTDMIEWKVGKDFYWLEIHYIKKKKRNFRQD